ncbi:uncharacterized protein K452DRAFT_282348 [Aplosporella prunicola CBS 121167]|uniref:Heterokaryon incompatibility domain-containing protein n=1 Tax=Aplosporella prunicola CBS 121167 TaxID=1176127 RepID=A0A6A6BX87_9PEZI|nr:uncharacterized protein K452DRAFT_282348 [Aplosporella prunicola CBS 121167]KAF2147341.1 hypothetical protein K452DRAFT_282348 [Aplosporella prunicola CBS 121167]
METSSIRSPAYRYRSLQTNNRQIRLIDLMPRFWDDPIHCTIRHVSLDDSTDNPDFDALSYAWGDPHLKTSIFIDGEEFPVTVNLSSALRHLRSYNKRYSLWVDALCINQADNDEKSSQVNMMGDIYKACREGILWLGNEREFDDQWCETERIDDCKYKRTPVPKPSTPRTYGPVSSHAKPFQHTTNTLWMDQQQMGGQSCKWHRAYPII